MPRKRKLDSPEDKLAQFFLKSVGVGLGLWNASAEIFVDDLEDQGVYQSNVDIFATAMKSGWTYDDLHHLIGSNYKNGVRGALATEIIPKREDPLKEADTLLEEGAHYFHPALFDVIAPRFAIAGSVMLPVTRGSVTPKGRFTLRDLMDYYYENIKTACIAKRRDAQTKTMVWLLGQASLDEILYAIDAASLTDDDIPVVEITNWLDEGQKELRYRRARSE